MALVALPAPARIERLIPMSPDLVEVLLAVVLRARAGEANVPLLVRYDHIEAARPAAATPVRAARRNPPGGELLQRGPLLHDVAADANLTDAGQPITFTPTTSGGCPLPRWSAPGCRYISPPHCSVTCALKPPRGYTAFFPAQGIAAHQHLIQQRRHRRPDGELRDATQQEWTSSKTTSCWARSPSVTAAGPTAPPLRPRARLCPLPVPVRRPRPATPDRGDDRQSRGPARRSQRTGLARSLPWRSPSSICGAAATKR